MGRGTDYFALHLSKVSKGLDMQGDLELGLALGVEVLCKAAIGKLLQQWQE
jgi:hypothetical protein